MRGKNWLATLNNPGISTEDFLKTMFVSLEATYLCGQLETGKQGTPHIHYYFELKDEYRLNRLKGFCSRSNFELARDPDAAAIYATKDKTRTEGPF